MLWAASDGDAGAGRERERGYRGGDFVCEGGVEEEGHVGSITRRAGNGGRMEL